MMDELSSQMEIPTIPSEIFRLALNNFDKENFYIKVGSNLGRIINGIDLTILQNDLQTLTIPLLLPFITFFQYYEKITDRAALESIRFRIEWKYALHLSIIPSKMEDTILCEFRRFILADGDCLREYQKLIDRFFTVLPPEKRQHISSSQMLHEVCEFNQKFVAVTALNNTLTILKLNYPKWLTKHDKPRLYARYLPSTSQFDVLIPHDITQFQLDDVLRDIDFLVKEIELSNLVEIKNIDEVVALSQIGAQIKMINAGKQTPSDCKNFIAIFHKQKTFTR
jgi:hypothetical protein